MTNEEISQYYDGIVNRLTADGWKEWSYLFRRDKPNYCSWFKTFPGVPQCRMNPGKPLQLEARLFDHSKYMEAAEVAELRHPPVGLTLILRAEPGGLDGCLMLEAWGFAIDSDYAIAHQCERLLTAWRAIVEQSEKM